MATTIKKQVGTSNRYVLKFDSPPSMTELRQAINSVDLADRSMKIVRVANAGDTVLMSPVKFVFVAEGETETDVPVA